MNFDINSFKSSKLISTSKIGSVYSVENQHQVVYRKKILNYQILNPKQKQEFFQSHNILMRINHPAINKIIYCDSCNIDNSLPIIISDFEVNGSLDDVLKSNSDISKLNATQKMITIFGVASALMYIHGCRLIHRNLKPSNILFDDKFEPKVTDLYFSRKDITTFFEKNDDKTPLHVAPELLEHESYNNKVDVYSFAILLYEILTGKEPNFELDDQEAIRAAIIIGNRPEIPRDIVPQAYIELINECWNNNGSERPTFKTIVRKLVEPELILPGTDMDLFLEYTKKCISNNFLIKSENEKGPSKRVEELKNEADAGNIESQYEYAVILNTGDGVARRNLKEAERYFKMASDKGHLLSKYQLGLLYVSLKKWDEAEVLLRESADGGNKDAQFYYAVMLKNGSGVQKDIFKAARYFKLAADQGDSDAQNSYATILLNGDGIIMNKKLAIQYFKRAADQGDHDAQNNFAMLLIQGEYIHKNVPLARKYLKKSAEQGDVNGMKNFADILINEGKKNAAAYYYWKSAQAGNEEAKKIYDSLNIIVFSDDDYEFLQEIESSDDSDDPKKIKEIEKQKQSLKELADSGNANAQYEYALFLKDKAVKLKLAFAYLKMAVSQQHPQAMFVLGQMYRDGVGTERNLKKARELFLRASELNVSDATAAYGYMRFKGLGFSHPNKEKARVYLEKAAEQKSGDALAFLGELIIEINHEHLMSNSAFNSPRRTPPNSANNSSHNSPRRLSFMSNHDSDDILQIDTPSNHTHDIPKDQNDLYDNSIERAEKLITESAELENPNGLYFLALFSKLNGQTDKYEKLLKDAAEKGSNQALFHIALKENDFSQMKICADRGVENASYIYASKILEYDTNEALWYFMKAAEDGNPKAMVEAAHYLWKSNPEKAEFYLKNAISKSKYPRAYSMYGLYLSTIKGDEKEAAHNFYIAAKLNDSFGMLQYGIALRDGKGVQPNHSKAIIYLKHSADLGNVEGMLQYALSIEDENEARRYFKRASNRGNYEAKYYLGMILKDEEQYEEAFHLFKTAADEGSQEDSMFQVAIFYKNGYGVEMNESKAIYYYALAANSANPTPAAQFNYALMLKEEGNFLLASKYFKAAALQGDSEAMNNYGLMLMRGEGVKKDLDEAKKYFKMSSDLGNSFGQNNLGLILKKVNPEESLRMFKLSMNQGNFSGMNNYALAIMGQHPETAFKLFKKAADAGHANAMFNYASMLKNIQNHSLERPHQLQSMSDDEITNEIEKYIKNSAKLGDMSAMISYANILKKNNKLTNAEKYLKKAVDSGSSTAMCNYATLLKERGEFVMAIEYYKKASKLGNTNAMNNLASMYIVGEGVEKDIDKAREIYRNSMKLGNERAGRNFLALSSPRK